jgi:hypothetical protein
LVFYTKKILATLIDVTVDGQVADQAGQLF